MICAGVRWAHEQTISRAPAGTGVDDAAVAERLAARNASAAVAGRPLRGKLPGIPDPAKAKPEPEQKGNRSDADSRIMRERAGGFIQGFNAQAAVDGHAQVIVAADVTSKQDDRAQLAPMLEQVEHNSGAKPAIVRVDTGYYSPKQVEPVFGQIKQWRGFRQFLLRGLEKTRAEWRLICLTHNLLKLHRFRWSPQTA